MRPDRLRIGLAQILVEGGRPEANLARAEEAIAVAAAAGCGLVVLPECLDLGWTHPSARELAEPIPGPRCERLAAAARRHGVWVAAGLVEAAGERRHNSAVLVSPRGELVLRQRKVEELAIARDLYACGDALDVAECELGTVALAVCADLLPGSDVGDRLCRLGARLVLSPSAWAVDADHDDAADPYGALWLESYRGLAARHGAAVVGVSCVGPLTAGPWAGRTCIGRSLAVGSDGSVLALGPYGVDAEALVVADVPLGVRSPACSSTTS